MNAGKMDRKVSLREPTQSTDNFGQTSETFAVAAEIWAQKRDLAAKEAVEADQIVASIRTEFLIRWRDDITPEWEVQLVELPRTTWKIHGILEIGRKEGLRLICTTKDAPR